MLKVHVLGELYRHSSNVAHGVEVPPGARLLFTNGQVGTRPDGTTPETTAEQAKVVFDRVEAVLAAASTALSDKFASPHSSPTSPQPRGSAIGV